METGHVVRSKKKLNRKITHSKVNPLNHIRTGGVNL